MSLFKNLLHCSCLNSPMKSINPKQQQQKWDRKSHLWDVTSSLTLLQDEYHSHFLMLSWLFPKAITIVCRNTVGPAGRNPTRSEAVEEIPTQNQKWLKEPCAGWGMVVYVRRIKKETDQQTFYKSDHFSLLFSTHIMIFSGIYHQDFMVPSCSLSLSPFC